MRTRIINLVDDIYILEIKCKDCYEYYIRSDRYPFEFVVGSTLEDKFNWYDLMTLLNNGYFDNWLEEH